MPARALPSRPTATPAASADLGETALAVVVEEKVRHRIVGDEHIRPAVIVVVADRHAETIADVLGDPGLGADVSEHALAVVAIEHAREPWVVERVAVDANAALRVAAERVLARRRVEVVGDEQIQIAVAIDVHERAARAPPVQPDARRARDVRERAVAGVSIQRVGTVVGDVEIGASVAIDVARARAHPVLAMDDAGGRRHVLEQSVALVVKEPVPRRLRLRRGRLGLPVPRSNRRRRRTDRCQPSLS